MATRRANFLLDTMNRRIDELDVDKAKRAEEKKLKEQQLQQEERSLKRLERDEQLLMRMNKTREERQDKDKLRQNRRIPLQRQMFHGRGRQNERTYE